jgi:hypothetical protein
MYPHERSLVKQLAGKPFAIIGVNSDKDLDVLKERIKEENISWRSFRNDEGTDGVISENWAVAGWPMVYILDEKGTIRWKGHGGPIDDVITELLGEMGHKVSIVHEDEEKEEEPKDEGEKDKGKKADKDKDADKKGD